MPAEICIAIRLSSLFTSTVSCFNLVVYIQNKFQNIKIVGKASGSQPFV